ncbi:MAG: TIGR00730 family Rossman fold protein [Bacteroidales bacterium]|nr:TIGR00730 family Rossman fold protein [Bacteroidales bacterium]
MRICVYCASSSKVDKAYFEATQKLAEDMAVRGITLVYGGGSAGLMGCIADNVLKNKGQVVGILPRFMDKVEWGHKGLTQLTLVKDMHERKKLLIKDVDAVVALPGGCGTLEELMEVITLKRLGKFTKPIIILNTNGFYDHLKLLLEKMIHEHFMRAEHVEIWQFVDQPEDIIPAIENAPKWDSSAIKFAAV